MGFYSFVESNWCYNTSAKNVTKFSDEVYSSHNQTMKVYPNPFKPTHIHAKETPLEWKLYSVDVTLVKQGNDPIINATEPTFCKLAQKT